MARHKVEICGVNTANIKVLTNEEMIKLFEKYRQGDLLAKEELVNGNLKLVLSILKSFSGRDDKEEVKLSFKLVDIEFKVFLIEER